MKKHYDFSKGKPNPFAKMLKQEVKISISNKVIEYFKQKEKETRIPYKTLINCCLLEYVRSDTEGTFIKT